MDGLRDDTAEKWKEWRTSGISAEYVDSLFIEERDYLQKSGAFERNSRKWPVDGKDDPYTGIRNWLSGRFLFLDQMYGYGS